MTKRIIAVGVTLFGLFVLTGRAETTPDCELPRGSRALWDVKAAPYLKIITMPPFTVSLNTPPAAENAYGTSA